MLMLSGCIDPLMMSLKYACTTTLLPISQAHWVIDISLYFISFWIWNKAEKNMKRYDFGVSSSRQCTIAQTCNDRSYSMLPALSFYLLPAHAFAHGVHATGTLWHRIRQRIHIPGSNKNNTETLRHVILHTWTREPVRQSADVVSILK